MTKWTEAEDAILRKGAQNGWSYTEVAEMLGKTKGQVAGRAWRLRVEFNSQISESAQRHLEALRRTSAVRRAVFG